MKSTYLVTLIAFLLVTSCYQELSMINIGNYSFVPDNDESVYIASSQGIIKFDGTKSSKILRSDYFENGNMKVDEQNNLWTIVRRNNNFSLYCFEQDEIKTYFLPDPSNGMQYIELGDLNFKQTDKKYINVFSGLYLFYETSIEPAKFVLTDYSSEQDTRYLTVDNLGNFWMQNNSDELVSYNGSTEKIFNNPLNVYYNFAISSTTQTFFVVQNTSNDPYNFYTFNGNDIVQDSSFQILTDYLTNNNMNNNTSNWTMDNDGTSWLIAEFGNTLLKFSKPATIEKITLPFHFEQNSNQSEMKSNKRGVLWFKDYLGFLYKYKNGSWEIYNVNEMQFF